MQSRASSAFLMPLITRGRAAGQRPHPAEPVPGDVGRHPPGHAVVVQQLLVALQAAEHLPLYRSRRPRQSLVQLERAQGIHRQHHSGVARGLQPGQEVLTYAVTIVDVLEPDGAGRRRSHLLDRVSRPDRQRHESVRRPRGPGRGQLAVGVRPALPPGRGAHHGEADLLTEYGGRQVAVAGVPEQPRIHGNLIELAVVAVQGPVAVRPPPHEPAVFRGHHSLGELLQLGDGGWP